MNEKKFFIVCFICLSLLSLSGCCTRAGIRDNGSGAYTVREPIGALADEQTESAIASERLNGAIEGARTESEQLSREITASREHSEQLERSIADGEADLENLAAILQQIRTRGSKPDSRAASDN